MRAYGVPMRASSEAMTMSAREREIAATADAPAVHLGDHRLRRVPDR